MLKKVQRQKIDKGMETDPGKSAEKMAQDTINLQDNLVSALDAVSATPFLGGVMHDAVSLVAGKVNEISHKLGKVPGGWFVLDKDAQADIWRDPVTNNNDGIILNLRTSADVTIRIWIYS
jgi:hypothetical protein